MHESGEPSAGWQCRIEGPGRRTCIAGSTALAVVRLYTHNPAVPQREVGRHHVYACDSEGWVGCALCMSVGPLERVIRHRKVTQELLAREAYMFTLAWPLRVTPDPCDHLKFTPFQWRSVPAWLINVFFSSCSYPGFPFPLQVCLI